MGKLFFCDIFINSVTYSNVNRIFLKITPSAQPHGFPVIS